MEEPTFGDAFAAAFNFFADNATRRDDMLYAERFYKIPEWDHDRYHRLHARFLLWSEAADNLLREAARAANWFADVVRRHVNPRFFHLEGRFLIIEGPNQDLAYTSRLYEYTAAERRFLPRALRKRLSAITAKFDKDPPAAERKRPRTTTGSRPRRGRPTAR